MSFNQEQFRSLIESVLTEFQSNLSTKPATELLMLTAAQESHLGTYLFQINGPAKGIFQIEPRTEKDIYKNFLRYKPKLKCRVKKFCSKNKKFDLELNLAYQIIMARLFYYRFSEPFPEENDIKGLAIYYKKYFNTKYGSATVAEAIENYRIYCEE